MMGILVWPARHPLVALLFSTFAIVGSIIAISHLRPDTSLESMMSRNDPAVAAAVRVLNEFPAAEELLVLATMPPSSAGDAPDPPRLISFAERLEQAIQNSPEASRLCTEINYLASPQFREYFEKVLVPNGIYYLDPPAFEAAQRRFTREQMVEQLRRDEAMLSAPGPGAAAMAKVFIKDPLRLHEFILDRLTRSRPFKSFQNSDAFFSPDGRSLLIRIAGKEPPSNLQVSKAITETITQLANQVNSDHFQLDISGAYAIATASERAIRRDMIASVVSSVIFLAILFAGIYRQSARLFFTALIPVAIGVLYGFAIYALFTHVVTPLTAVIGGILAGMGIDYSIQYISQYQIRRRLGLSAEQAIEATIGSIGSALFAAWATSIVGFIAITWSKVQALRDFALVGSLGLTGAFVTSMFILPALLAVQDRKASTTAKPIGPRFDVAPLLRWVYSHRSACIGACGATFAAALAIIIFQGHWLEFESDLSVMHPRPNPALDAQTRITERMGASPGSLIVYLKSNSGNELVRLSHRVAEQLMAEKIRRTGVSGVFGLATLVPDPTLIEGRRAAMKAVDVEAIIRDFRASISQTSFVPEAFEPYIGFLRYLLTESKPPTIGDLLAYPQLAKLILPKSAFANRMEPKEAITLVFFDLPLDSGFARARAIDSIRESLNGLPGATLTGLSVVGNDMQFAIQHDIRRLTFAAVAIILAYLLAQLRDIRSALLSILPTAFGLALTFAVLQLLGRKLNMVNLVAIPLLIGIDVDYAIFVVMASRLRNRLAPEIFDAHFASSTQAVITCAAATLLGFGSLVFTSVPAVQSLGLAVAVGIISGIGATLFCVLPLLSSGRTERISNE